MSIVAILVDGGFALDADDDNEKKKAGNIPAAWWTRISRSAHIPKVSGILGS